MTYCLGVHFLGPSPTLILSLSTNEDHIPLERGGCGWVRASELTRGVGG